MVTDLDLASEKLLLERILTAYPSHTVIAEESGLVGAAGGEWTWLVDPLDGTNNVAIGLPAYVVGVALCRDGLPLLGVVHDPVSRQTWSALRGRARSPPRACAWRRRTRRARTGRCWPGPRGTASPGTTPPSGG
ncbi:inositol monophosphatase family protein [Nonomuraea rubra]|uniref:inositol monophosphatase family protein n=1 Tax=Nonomuraea rubra TaxID=46180 RepID=UPI00362007C0